MTDPFMINIIGIGVMTALLLYLMSILDDKKHMILKLIIVVFVISIIMLIPKSAIDSTTVCETVVANSTDVSSTVTSYDYESFCYERSEITAYSFFKQTNRLYYLILAYSIVYLFMLAIMKLEDSGKIRIKGKKGK